MANKLKLSLNNLLGILTFTLISAIALIITGITLSWYPEVEFHKEIIERKYVIDYTHCTPIGHLKTCEDYFYNPLRNTKYCFCFLADQFIDLRGELTVHSELEMSNQEFLNIGNSSVKSFEDLKSTSLKQCDPYTTEETTGNDTCEAISDEIFQDYLTLTKTYESKEIEVNCSKAVRWGPAVKNSANGFQNAISVLMVSEWRYKGPDSNSMNTFSAGNYTLTIKFYQNVNIWRRALVISTQNIDVQTTCTFNVFYIVALFLGMVLLFGSIGLFALRKRITGVKESNISLDIAEDTPNNRRSEFLPEEKPLSVLE